MTKSLFRNIAQLLMGDTDNPPASDFLRTVKSRYRKGGGSKVHIRAYTHYNYIFPKNQYINVFWYFYDQKQQ